MDNRQSDNMRNSRLSAGLANCILAIKVNRQWTIDNRQSDNMRNSRLSAGLANCILAIGYWLLVIGY
jgi:hypothetical protein